MRFLVEIPSAELADADIDISDKLWVSTLTQVLQQTWPDVKVMVDDRPDP